ncbi:MAG: hypothetical protein Q9161_006057 [Pseudevernia consocians]
MSTINVQNVKKSQKEDIYLKNDLVVIGAGACGVAVVAPLIERVKQGKKLRCITLTEKSKRIGPGLTYSDATFCSLDGNSLSQSEEYSFSPRHIYGVHLSSVLDGVAKDATQFGVTFGVVNDEAADLGPVDQHLEVILARGTRIQTPNLVLALGNFPATVHSELIGSPGFISPPWPLRRLEVIPYSAPVSIVGSGPTAIDVAILLTENGHKGRITFVSRNGRLPKVQGIFSPFQRRYMLHLLATDVETSEKGALSKVISTIKQEVESLDRNKHYESDKIKASKDPLVEFRADVKSAEDGAVSWQSIIKATTPVIERISSPNILTPHPAGGISVNFSTLLASKNIHVIGSMTRGTHFFTNAVDRNATHASRIADSIAALPPRRPLHLAFFVGSDLFSHLMLSKLVPRLVAQGYTPFIFLPAVKVNKKIRAHYGIFVQRVKNVNDPSFLETLRKHHIDAGFSLRCYQRFGEDKIDHFAAPRALLNFHPDTLPSYRGLLTAIRAMANKEPSFGHSLHHISSPYDAGPAIDVRTAPIDYEKSMLHYMNEVYPVGVDMVLDAVDNLARGKNMPAIEQDEAKSRYYTFPTEEALEVVRKRGVRLVDAEAMEEVLVDSFAGDGGQDAVRGLVREAVREWYGNEGAILARVT